MSKKEITPGCVCYFKIWPTSADYHVNGMFITVKERRLIQGQEGQTAVWTFTPDIFSPRLGRNFDFAFERTLVPVAGPTVEDVKDTLEVLQMGNTATFDALRELSKKAKDHSYEDQKT